MICRVGCLAMMASVAVLCWAVIATGHAAETVLAFDTPAQESRYTELLEEYRCLKCQNQSLADSPASLAVDLRREIYERVLADQPTAAIDDYLVARYGEFVLYRPRLSMATLVLWAGPFVLLVVTLVAAVAFVRRHGPARVPAKERGAATPSAEALATARRLLDDATTDAGARPENTGQGSRFDKPEL